MNYLGFSRVLVAGSVAAFRRLDLRPVSAHPAMTGLPAETPPHRGHGDIARGVDRGTRPAPAADHLDPAG